MLTFLSNIDKQIDKKTVRDEQKSFLDTETSFQLNLTTDRCLEYSTMLITRLTDVLDAIRGDTKTPVCFQFHPQGINIHGVLCDNRVVIDTFLTSDIFTDIKCDNITQGSYVLHSLARRCKEMARRSSGRLCISVNGGVLSASVTNNSTESMVRATTQDGVPVINLEAYEYTSHIQVDSDELLTILSHMPTIFTIRLDKTDRHLVFEGTEDSSTMSMFLTITDDDIFRDTIQSVPAVTYRKSMFTHAIRLLKIHNHVRLGFREGVPLLLLFTIGEEQPEQRHVSMCSVFIHHKSITKTI